MKKAVLTASALAVAAAVLPACSPRTVEGRAVAAPSMAATPVAPSTTPASAPRTRDDHPDSAKDWRIDLSSTGGMSLDELVRTTVTSASTFWNQQYGLSLHLSAEAVPVPVSCPDGFTDPTTGAMTCDKAGDGVIVYAPSILQADRDAGGDLTIILSMAHEVGHGVGDARGYSPEGLAPELSADCFAGFYMKQLGAPAEHVGDAFRATAELMRVPGGIEAMANGYARTKNPMTTCTSY